LHIDRSLWLPLIFAFLIASIPTAAGMLKVPDAGEWTGILSRNTADVNGYLGMIEEVRQGNIRTHNLFTAEPHPAFQFRPLWIALGFIGRFFPGVSNAYLMEFGRILSSFFLLLLFAALATRMFTVVRQRVIAFLVLTFGSGLGWMRLVQDPPDLRIVETSNFLTLLSPPLYSLSLSLVVLILLCVQQLALSEKKFPAAIIGGIASLWLGFDRPFSLATLGVSIAGMILVDSILNKRINWKIAFALLPIALGGLFALSYQAWAVRNISVYAAWNRQHILPTPPWWNLFSALGLLIPLAIAGAGKLFRQDRSLALTAGFFIAASLFLSHLPVGFQERFLEGLPLMTAIFAAAGLNRFLNRISWPSLQTLIATILLVILSISHYFPVRTDLVAIAKQSPPQYMPRNVVDAMRTAGKLAKPDEAILSGEATGNFLIAYSGRQVVLGHKIATADYPEKWKLVNQFLRTPADDSESKELFEQSQAKWLFWGPEESLISHGIFQPDRAPYLVEKYNNGFIRIFTLK
jgi:hypothetical protein